MPNCKNCGSTVSDSSDRCYTCGADIGFPNVRTAQGESTALEGRYVRVLDDSHKDGRWDSLTRFAESMAKTCAVINVDLRDLHHLLSKPRELYSTYQLGVKSETRKAAEESNDRHRMSIDGLFFGSYGDKIRYAALSLDGRGLKSYGDYSLRLREIVVRNRASLLEENTYLFAKNHSMVPGSPIPPGYRSTWPERHRLAVAKLGSLVLETTPEKEYPQMLLTNGGSKASDKFIEIHIYGPLDGNSIESVTGKSIIKKHPARGLAAEVKEYLRRAGQAWIEE